jgi:hypothetical protein
LVSFVRDYIGTGLVDEITRDGLSRAPRVAMPARRHDGEQNTGVSRSNVSKSSNAQSVIETIIIIIIIIH